MSIWIAFHSNTIKKTTIIIIVVLIARATLLYMCVHLFLCMANGFTYWFLICWGTHSSSMLLFLFKRSFNSFSTVHTYSIICIQTYIFFSSFRLNFHCTMNVYMYTYSYSFLVVWNWLCCCCCCLFFHTYNFFLQFGVFFCSLHICLISLLCVSVARTHDCIGYYSYMDWSIQKFRR